jgi:hypothetical protein
MPRRTGTLSDNTAGLQFAGSRSPPQLWTFTNFIVFKNIYIKKPTVYTWPLSGRASYTTLCHVSLSFCYNNSSVTSTVLRLTATKLKPLIFHLSKFHKQLFYSGQTDIIHFTEGTQCGTRLAQSAVRDNVTLSAETSARTTVLF